MSRYFSRPAAIRVRAAWDEDVPLLPTITVDDVVVVETGLVDQNGNDILRAPDPIGFHRPRG